MRWLFAVIEKLFQTAANFYQFGNIVLGIGILIPLALYVVIAAPVALVWFVFDSVRTLNWMGLYFIAVGVGVLWWLRLEGDSPQKIQVRRGRTVVDHVAAKEKLRRVLAQRRSSGARGGGRS
jgi:hypothetical protein